MTRRRKRKHLPSRIIVLGALTLLVRKTHDGYWVARNAYKNLKYNDRVFVALTLPELIRQLRDHRDTRRERLSLAVRHPKGARRQRHAEQILALAELPDTEENRARAIQLMESLRSCKAAAYMLRAQKE